MARVGTVASVDKMTFTDTVARADNVIRVSIMPWWALV